METSPTHVVRTVAQAIVILLAAPLVTGYVQKLKARLQCRAGASVWQPYRDLAKLLRKGTVQADTATPFFRAVPVLVLAATVTAATISAACATVLTASVGLVSMAAQAFANRRRDTTSVTRTKAM